MVAVGAAGPDEVALPLALETTELATEDVVVVAVAEDTEPEPELEAEATDGDVAVGE